jgi:hypothetical protein
MMEPFPEKPKGMRWRTYERLFWEHHEAEMEQLIGIVGGHVHLYPEAHRRPHHLIPPYPIGELVEAAVGSQLIGSTDVIRVVRGSEHNHGNEPRALLLAHLLECPEAVDAKHVEVQEDQARHIHGATLGRQQVVDDLHSVTSYNHLVGESLCLQKAYGKFGGRRIVLYQ